MPLPAKPAGALAGLLALGAVTALAACGSASSPAAGSTALYGTAVQRQCTEVAGVLSDGPDPVLLEAAVRGPGGREGICSLNRCRSRAGDRNTMGLCSRDDDSRRALGGVCPLDGWVSS